MSSKTALFDIDGVLLDMWKPMHSLYQDFHGRKVGQQEWLDTIRDFELNPAPYADFRVYFSTSPEYSALPKKIGMDTVIKTFKQNNFDIFLITAGMADEQSKIKRQENLISNFGNIFTDTIYTGLGSKKDAIKQIASSYDYSIFIDDTPKHVQASVGLVNESIWLHNPQLENHKNEMDISKIKIAYKPVDILNIAVKSFNILDYAKAERLASQNSI